MNAVLPQPLLPLQRAYLPLLLLVAGWLVMFMPTYVGLANTIWGSDANGHGPIILAVSFWLALKVALRSRGITLADRRRLYAAIRQRQRHRARQLVDRALAGVVAGRFLSWRWRVLPLWAWGYLGVGGASRQAVPGGGSQRRGRALNAPTDLWCSPPGRIAQLTTRPAGAAFGQAR